MSIFSHSRSPLRTLALGQLFVAAFLWSITLRAMGAEAVASPSPLSESAELVLDHIAYLASDELKGRAVGTLEIDQAAEYIAAQLQALGTQVPRTLGSPFQEVQLSNRFRLGDAATNHVILKLADRASEDLPADWASTLAHGNDFQTLAIGGSGQVETEIVFAGYGITAPEFGYDDYANIDARGKIVVVVRKEPQQTPEAAGFSEKAPTKHAYFRTKVLNAVAHGAAAILFVNDRGTLDDQQRRSGDETTETDLDRVLPLEGAGATPVANEFPVVFCRRHLIDSLLRHTINTTLDTLEASMNRLEPVSQLLPACRATVSTEMQPVAGRNVISVIEGTGELAHETIVIGAHYDHVGEGGPGSLAPWTNAVHNGADDNASGVAALLEVARQLGQRETPLRRRIVLIAFTAEELGLLGSEHYVRHPLFSLDDTVAMLNLDMVGRLGDGKLQIHGIETATEFAQLVLPLAAEHQLPITTEPSGNGPSDHATFYRKGIPVLHFFTGLHRDYHRPGDDVEKIDLAGVCRIATLTTEIAVRLAEEPQRPTFQRKSKKSAGTR